MLTSLIFAVVIWGVVFVLIKPKRIKMLLPVAILSIVVLSIGEYSLIALKFFRFNNPLLPIGGIPLFHLVWGAGGGLLGMNYMQKDFKSKSVTVIFFTFVALFFEFISLSVGASSMTNGFNLFYSSLVDLVGISLIVWLSEVLWGERIYPPQKVSI